MKVMQQSLFDSQAHRQVIQVHKYSTKYETFRFALLAGNPFTHKHDSSAWSQLSAVLFGKIQVLAKSRDRCKWSFFGSHFSACFLYFFTFLACYVAFHPQASMSFDLQWLFKPFHDFLLHINGLCSLNTVWIFDWKKRLRAVMTGVYTHYLCHASLSHCIFACECSRLSSLLTVRRLSISKQLWILWIQFFRGHTDIFQSL